MSVGDTGLAAVHTPAFTALRWSLEDVGHAAVGLLLQRLSGDVGEALSQALLPADLVLRDSCDLLHVPRRGYPTWDSLRAVLYLTIRRLELIGQTSSMIGDSSALTFDFGSTLGSISAFRSEERVHEPFLDHCSAFIYQDEGAICQAPSQFLYQLGVGSTDGRSGPS